MDAVGCSGVYGMLQSGPSSLRGTLGERVLGVADELQQAWESGTEVPGLIEALWAQGGICETTGDS